MVKWSVMKWFFSIPFIILSTQDLEQAERLFQATLFEASLEKYEGLSETPEIRSRIVENLFFLNRYEQALSYGSELSERGRYFYALSLARLGREKEAVETLEKMREGEFRDQVHLELGQIYLSSDLQKALQAFKAVSSPQAQLKVAEVQIKLGDYKQAAETLKKVAGEEKAFLSGLVALQLQQLPEAIAWLEKAPKTSDTLYTLGWTYLLNGSFQQAEQLFRQKNEPRFALALAHCYIQLGQPQKAVQIPHSKEHAAMLLLKARYAPTFEEREKLFAELVEGPFQSGAIWYERGLNAFKEGKEELARVSLERASDSDKTLFLLGQLLFKQKKWAEAEALFLKLMQSYPKSPLVADSLLFVANCTEGQKAREYRRTLFETYPEAPAAGEAYFGYYSYRDYVQGDRTALKHLQKMEELFPDSPYLISAHYLIGLDEKRDRKSAHGKWIRKKNMMEAIDSLQAAETLFERLEKSMGKEERAFFQQVRYQATLERAQANLQVAEESQGAKRQIFLQYAAEVFSQLRNELKGDLREESTFWLAQTVLKTQDEAAAEQLFQELVKASSAYYRGRSFVELGKIAMRQDDLQKALSLFAKAEGSPFSADEKIDLWIQKSLCYRDLQDYDQAMLILSQAINDPCISSLRVKAMYLRAEIYALQGRHELAKKQKEAADKKGGKNVF